MCSAVKFVVEEKITRSNIHFLCFVSVLVRYKDNCVLGRANGLWKCEAGQL